jgi:hypothetical protein
MSERRQSKDPLGPLAGGDRTRPKSERERLELDVTHLDGLRAWHKQLAKRHGRKVKAIRRKLMKMPVDPGLDEFELSEEEKAECAAEAHEGMARFRLGGGAQPAFESSKEAGCAGNGGTSPERRPGSIQTSERPPRKGGCRRRKRGGLHTGAALASWARGRNDGMRLCHVVRLYPYPYSDAVCLDCQDSLAVSFRWRWPVASSPSEMLALALRTTNPAAPDVSDVPTRDRCQMPS